MTEIVIVNVALAIRVCLLGGILILLPRITRRGLLLGAYVGEDVIGEPPAKQLLHRWVVGCLFSMGLALLVGMTISFAGWPLTGNLTGTAVLLVAAAVHYAGMHSRARRLAPSVPAPQTARATASLAGGEPRGAAFARLALLLCLVTSLATVTYATVSYAAMPEYVPTLSGLAAADELARKSILTFLFVPSLSLVISPFFALLALFTARAKRSLRGGSGGRSLEAQDAFRAANTILLSGLALLLCALLTLFGVQIVRIGTSQAGSLGAGIWWLVGVLLVYTVAGLIVLIRRHGQGGARNEEGSIRAPLTGGVADNERWVLGLFYVDREDPSLMVEKRFGIGYTLNYGNRHALWFVGTFLALLLGLAALALGASLS